MNRRTFLRVIGGVAFTSVVAPRYVFGDLGSGSSGVLVEACGFDDLGGWKLDTQFYQQMGGNIYTMQDATEHRELPDTVVEETRALEGH